MDREALRQALDARDELGLLTQTNVAIQATETSLQGSVEDILRDVFAAAGAATAKQVRRAVLRGATFDPDQPRDDHGQWSASGGGSTSSTSTQARLSELDLGNGDMRVPFETHLGEDGDLPKDLQVDEERMYHLETKAKVEVIDPSGLIATQGTVQTATVKHFIDHPGEGNNEGVPIVVQKEGKRYILDGHHRLTADALAGRQSKAKVLKLDRKKLRGAADDIRSSWKFDVTDPRAVQWIKQHAGDLITGVSKRTREEIRDLVEEAFTEQYTVDELADEVDDIIGDESRAETIARTETMRASNEGQNAAWEQAQDAGLLTGDEVRVWITTPDDRLCPICEPLDGERAAFGDTFEVDGDDLEGPPAHPNCRCVLGLVIP